MTSGAGFHVNTHWLCVRSWQVLKSSQGPGVLPRWSPWIGNRGKERGQGRFFVWSADSFLDLFRNNWKFSFLPSTVLLFIIHIYSDPPRLLAGLHNLSIPKSLDYCCQNSSSVVYQLPPHLCHIHSSSSCERSHSSTGLRTLLWIRVTVWLWPNY